MAGKAIPLEGQVFFEWTVLRRASDPKSTPSGTALWVVQCSCGSIATLPSDSLRGGKSTRCKSCSSKGSYLTSLPGNKMPHYKGGCNTYGSEAYWNSKLASYNHSCRRRGHAEIDITGKELADMCRDDPPECEICGAGSSYNGKPLVADHDHTTGRFRGFLCSSCNCMLGYAKDDPVILREGARYVVEP